jgi:hypothetical protein
MVVRHILVGAIMTDVRRAAHACDEPAMKKPATRAAGSERAIEREARINLA